MKHLKRILFLPIFGLLTFSLYSEEFDPNSVRSPDCKPGTFSCGYLPASKEIQDSIPIKRDFNSFDDLPKSVDLSSQMPPVGNQGRQNSCVAWASGYAIKSYLLKNGGQISSYDPPFQGGQGKNVFSPAFIYNQQNGGKDQGLYYYKTMDFLQKSGVVPWSSMPYSDKDYLTQPPNKVKQEGLNYRIKSYSRLNMKNPDDLKRVLASGNVVLFGIIIDDGFYKLKGSEVYDQNSGKSYGGHAMTIVGYDDNKKANTGRKGAFKIQNSWGTNWGDKGFGWISYNMMAKVGQEAYSMVDEKKVTTTESVSAPSSVVLPPTVTTIQAILPPSEIKASRGEFTDKIILTWNAIDKAVVYLIQRMDESGKFEDLAYSETTTFADQSVSENASYKYRIVSLSTEEISGFSQEIEGFTSSLPVANGKLEKVVGLNGKSYVEGTSTKIVLSWSEVSGAKGYVVSKASQAGVWRNLTVAKGTSYVDSSPTKGENNVYRVAASTGSKGNGDWSDTIGVMVGTESLTPTQVTDLTATYGDYADKVVLSWNQSPGASIYYLYRFDQNAEPSGQFEVKGNSFEDTDPVLKDHPYFIYTVISANDTSYAEPSEVALGKVNPEVAKRGAGVTLPAPKELTYSLNSKDNKISLKWKPVKDSHEYYIYRMIRTPKNYAKKVKFEFVNSVAGKLNSYSENFLGKPGEIWMYTVRSKSEFGSESTDSNIITTFVNIQKAAVKKRAFSLEEIPKTFLGSWSGFHWHPKFGPQELQLEVTGANQSFVSTLKINGKPTKEFKGDWTPGSSGLKTGGFQFDLSNAMEGSSVVKLSAISVIEEGSEISFSKD